jgi:hypothetical protein
MSVDLNKKYIINPNYLIKPDNSRAIITTRYKYKSISPYLHIDFSDDFRSFIP